MDSQNPHICRMQKKWIQSLKRHSTQISESGETQRIAFLEKHYCSPIIRPLHFLHHFTTSPYWWAIQGEGGIPVSYTSCLRRLNRLHKCTKHPNCFPQEQYQESFHLVLPINKGIQPEGEEGERGKSNWKTSYLGI